MEMRHVAAATLMVIVLTGAAACGGSDSAGSSPQGKSTGSAGSTGKPAGGTSAASGGSRTALTKIDFCKAVKADSLTAIGVQPSGAVEGSESGRSSDAGCDWKTAGTEVQISAIKDWHVDMSEGQKKIEVLGFRGIQDVVIGNGCEVTMQVGADELEVNVLNDDGSNQALQGGKACDAALDFTRQTVVGVAAK